MVVAKGSMHGNEAEPDVTLDPLAYWMVVLRRLSGGMIGRCDQFIRLGGYTVNLSGEAETRSGYGMCTGIRSQTFITSW